MEAFTEKDYSVPDPCLLSSVRGIYLPFQGMKVSQTSYLGMDTIEVRGSIEKAHT